MRAAFAVVDAKLAIRTFRLPEARSILARLQGPRWIAASAPAERIVWAVETASRTIPGMKNCLVQALAAEAILLRAGYQCELRIGAAKSGSKELIAHAWLESDGRVLIGEFELDRYTPLKASQPGDPTPALRA